MPGAKANTGDNAATTMIGLKALMIRRVTEYLHA
jgi:hypothetical protein